MGVSGYAYYSLYKKNQEQAEQIKVLENQIQAMSVEDLVPVVVANQSIKSGTILDETMFKTESMNRASVKVNMITDLTSVNNKLLKINTPIEGIVTADMITEYKYGATDRLELFLVDNMSPSLAIGDYVDLRMSTPFGINYVVLPKKRVVNIYSSGIEVVMSEAEFMIYFGLLIDKSMNPGTVISASKYLDPVVQKANYAMYVPPASILEYMKVNANMIYPYLASDDVQGLRAYIESTQPWMLYGPSTFETVTESIVDKQTKITEALASYSSAMSAARAEYLTRQIEASAATGEEGIPQNTTGQVESEIVPSDNGTYIDASGVERDAEGNPIIQPSDLAPGITEEVTLD